MDRVMRRRERGKGERGKSEKGEVACDRFQFSGFSLLFLQRLDCGNQGASDGILEGGAGFSERRREVACSLWREITGKRRGFGGKLQCGRSGSRPLCSSTFAFVAFENRKREVANQLKIVRSLSFNSHVSSLCCSVQLSKLDKISQDLYISVTAP